MNHTHIALLALLLPFSGSAITKEERKRELEIKQLQVLVNAVTEWVGIFAGLSCIQDAISRLPQNEKDEIKSLLAELREKMESIDKEITDADLA